MRSAVIGFAAALLGGWWSVPATRAEEVVAALERETVAMPSGLEGWQLGWHGAVVESHTLEWVTGGETVDNWTQLFSVQRMVVPAEIAAGQYARLLLESLRHRCGGLQSTVLDDGRDSALYEWSVAGCPGEEDQHELVRVLRTGDYVFRIAYTRKASAIAAEAREQWLSVLRQVHPVHCCEADDKGLSAIPLVRLLATFRFNEVPGMRLAFELPGESGSRAAEYRLASAGFPSDHRYDLYMIVVQTAEAVPVAHAMVADEHGVLRCPPEQASPEAAAGQLAKGTDLCKGFGPGNELDLHFTNSRFQKGLPMIMGVRSTDGAHATYARVAPNPIAGVGGTCRLELELVSTDARTFVAYGTGFPPGEMVTLAWTYGGNSAGSVVRGDSAGAFIAAVNHPGQASGRSRWDARLQAASSKCHVDVKYRWGEEGMKP